MGLRQELLLVLFSNTRTKQAEVSVALVSLQVQAAGGLLHALQCWLLAPVTAVQPQSCLQHVAPVYGGTGQRGQTTCQWMTQSNLSVQCV